MTMLSAAEYRALSQKPAVTPRTPPVSTSASPQASKGPQKQENEEDETPAPALGAQHYIGPFQLTVANGTHFPGRMRAVVVGPADEGLLRAVLDAMKTYCSTPTAGA